MLEKKTKVDQRTQLLQAREEGLKSLQNGVLKPHGKLLGMDVFSWLNPDVHMLMNTLHSFPFPVIWIAQKMDWDALLNLDNTILSNMEVTIIYDAEANSLKSNNEEPFKIVKKTSLTQALNYLDHLKAFKSVLLFTSSGDEKNNHFSEFEQYLEMHQIKR
jgi:hypothetical protein